MFLPAFCLLEEARLLIVKGVWVCCLHRFVPSNGDKRGRMVHSADDAKAKSKRNTKGPVRRESQRCESLLLLVSLAKPLNRRTAAASR